jgi:hypothetical protein
MYATWPPPPTLCAVGKNAESALLKGDGKKKGGGKGKENSFKKKIVVKYYSSLRTRTQSNTCVQRLAGNVRRSCPPNNTRDTHNLTTKKNRK